jgi:mono/diheme cytochrome c family protein
MNRITKLVLSVLGGFAGLILVFGIYVYAVSNSRITRLYNVKVTPIATSEQKKDIVEGERLFVSRACVDCHGTDLSGINFINDPAIGTFTGANLTMGKGGLPADYSLEDFDRAIRHGLRRDGSVLVGMPSFDFYAMSDSDLSILVSYIQNAKPVEKESAKQIVGPLARVLLVLGKLPLAVPAEHIDHEAKVERKVKAEVSLEYGKYIATGCVGCHGISLKGGPIEGAPPEWPEAQNLTSSGSLGKWSEKEFITAIRTGKRPDGSQMKAPMPWQNLALMTDTEIKAVRLYLISL